MFGRFVGVFASLWHLARRGVPTTVLAPAIVLVARAAYLFADNAQRREWAVVELMRLTGVSESVARLIVELAVQRLKPAEAR